MSPNIGWDPAFPLVSEPGQVAEAAPEWTKQKPGGLGLVRAWMVVDHEMFPRIFFGPYVNDPRCYYRVTGNIRTEHMRLVHVDIDTAALRVWFLFDGVYPEDVEKAHYGPGSMRWGYPTLKGEISIEYVFMPGEDEPDDRGQEDAEGVPSGVETTPEASHVDTKKRRAKPAGTPDGGVPEDVRPGDGGDPEANG